MRHPGTLKQKVIPAGEFGSTLTPRLLQFALSGNEPGRIGVAILLLTLLLLLPLTLLFVLSLLRPGYLITVLAWMMFGLLSVWVGSKLEYILHPERLAYQRIIEACNQIIRDVSDQDIVLDRLAHTLYYHLGLESISVWRYQAEEKILTLSRFEGEQVVRRSLGQGLFGGMTELPLDLDLQHLYGTWSVPTLPESALRRGLLAGGVQVVASLNLGEELIGIIGLGKSRFGARFSPEALRWLSLVVGQLALVVKSAYLLTDLEDTFKKLQLAYRRSIDAEDEERRRLAVELHDEILSRLTTMSLTLRHSQKLLDAEPDRVRDCLNTIEVETQAVNRRLREITQGLHPSVLMDLGLISALQAYMDSLVKRSLPSTAPRLITLTAQGFNGDRLAERNLERDLYYIVRQALDNAIRHAQAEQVFIHLRWREDSVSVTVQDNGRGMKDQPEKLMGQNGRLGLLSMNERVLTWQGRLTFHTGPGQGTTIQVRLPIDQPSPDPAHLQAFSQILQPETVEDR
jgi:signal transduction histidine kinase